MTTAIVSLADVAAEPGHPLDPHFWCGRLPGESYRQFQLREQIDHQIAVIAAQQARLTRQVGELLALHRQRWAG
jgi:hypothetical protein